ncbi:MAG TPA: DedA family protein [Cyanobacteria bacterium UBA8803]|nr:DedA family protein [Cyanobacteria bacterium UBA9273]HBL61654.1 DedA family protein [Cyanobacteria bacterium UBA8803]
MSLEFLSLETIHEIARQYGYWAVFLGILLENLGLPIPGETVTLVGGFLAGSGQLNYWLVLASASGGAVLGGTCGYWIGRYGGWPLLVKVGKFFGIHEAKLEQVRTEFSENASKAVFAGRFIALLRIVASPLAGIANMPFWKFMLYNFAGAAAWGAVMVSLAFFAGQVIPLEKLLGWVAKFGVVALILVVAWFAVPIWLESRQLQDPKQ